MGNCEKFGVALENRVAKVQYLVCSCTKSAVSHTYRITIYMFVTVFFDLNQFMVHTARFTGNIFAFLILIAFIVKIVGNIFGPTRFIISLH